MVAALRQNRSFAQMLYGCSMTAGLFEIWFVEYLLPNCVENDVIIMDNATFHNKKRLLSYAQRFGISLWFLPPYSPQLNPIEKYWANMKRYLRNYLSSFCNVTAAMFHFFLLR